MLPNALNSKNRLYFERDSKNRRITSNIGNVFRNSKWSDYSLKNTNYINKAEFFTIIKSFIKTIVFFYLLSIIFILLVDIYYINFYKIFNCIFDLIDFANLSISSLLESGKFFFILIIQIIWKNIFEKLFSHTWNKQIFNYTNPYNFKIQSSTENVLNLQQFKQYNSNFNNNYITNLNKNLFKFESKDSILLNNLINATLQQTYKNNLITIRPVFEVKPINSLFYNSFNMTKWYATNTKVLNNNSNSFYIYNLNYQILNKLVLDKNMQTMSLNIVNHNNIAKSLRWSYRYSNIHRKTLINSHKLTSVKKLLGSGFFDSTSTKNNIWFSDNFSRITNFTELSKTLNSHWVMMYKSNILSKNTKPYLNTDCFTQLNNNFNFLSFYESSFQFFLKRLYIYSNLQTNHFTSKPINFISNNSVNTDIINNYSLYYSNLLQKNVNNDDIFNPFIFKQNEKSKNLFSNVKYNSSKDLYLNVIDSDFLLNDNLELLINLNNSLLEKSLNIKYFNINQNIVFKPIQFESKNKRNF